jgi:hypothetical protein
MVRHETARKFTFDVGWVFIASIAAMGFGLLIRILLGNYFDASGLGAYAMVLTIWGIVTLTTGASFCRAEQGDAGRLPKRHGTGSSYVLCLLILDCTSFMVFHLQP